MSSTTTTQIVSPARNLQGSLTLPGDKSISHRYAMLAGIAEGTTHLSNFSTGADPHSSLACMQALGAKVVHNPDKTISVTGTAGSFIQPTTPLDCGNSGSTMRMLAGLIAPHPHTFTLIGDHSLTLRPMERIRKPLMQMGAKLISSKATPPSPSTAARSMPSTSTPPSPAPKSKPQSSSPASRQKAPPASLNPSAHAITLSTLSAPSEQRSRVTAKN